MIQERADLPLCPEARFQKPIELSKFSSILPENPDVNEPYQHVSRDLKKNNFSQRATLEQEKKSTVHLRK